LHSKNLSLELEKAFNIANDVTLDEEELELQYKKKG
jgi:hypothetical protein